MTAWITSSVDALGARFGFPIIEHFGESADDRCIVISIPMFEAEKFSEFL